MEQKITLEFLKADPMKFTLTEIEQIMDEEMAKDSTEMDGNLVELCANVLTEQIK